MNKIIGSVAVIQQINRDFYAIKLCREAMERKASDIQSIPLVDNKTGLPVSKEDFKDIGAATMITKSTNEEISITLAANSIETFQIRMKRHLEFSWDPFREPCDAVPFANRVRMFRAINNVLKHNEGYIEASSSKSSQFLVHGNWYPDESYLPHCFPMIEKAELALAEAYTHLFLVCASQSVPSMGDRFKNLSGKSLVDEVNSFISYEIINKHGSIQDKVGKP